MIIDYLFALLNWLPGPLAVVAYAVICIFVFWSILKVLQIIIDIIPFI